jgi:hypothetical protein
LPLENLLWSIETFFAIEHPAYGIRLWASSLFKKTNKDTVGTSMCVKLLEPAVIPASFSLIFVFKTFNALRS